MSLAGSMGEGRGKTQLTKPQLEWRMIKACLWGLVMRTALLGDGFIISCPVTATGLSPVREIRKRGNIPLVLEEDVVVELKRSDMLESWRSTCALGRKKSEAMIAEAANRISVALEDEDVADMESLAGDMRAFFLLAVHQKGLDVTQASRFCTMAWHERADDHLQVSRY